MLADRQAQDVLRALKGEPEAPDVVRQLLPLDQLHVFFVDRDVRWYMIIGSRIHRRQTERRRTYSERNVVVCVEGNGASGRFSLGGPVMCI